MELDSYDRKLLRLLQENNKLSQRDLAEAVSLSASAVNRRIAALEEARVIRANVSVVDAAALGRPITILVGVKLENERLDLLDEVCNRFVSRPEVQQVYYVTGDFDFMLVLNVRSMTEYEALTRELFLVFRKREKLQDPRRHAPGQGDAERGDRLTGCGLRSAPLSRAPGARKKRRRCPSPFLCSHAQRDRVCPMRAYRASEKKERSMARRAVPVLAL